MDERSPQRYFITEGAGPEREVTVRQYVSMEARAGFNGPGHLAEPPYPACASFGATKGAWSVRGRTERDDPMRLRAEVSAACRRAGDAEDYAPPTVEDLAREDDEDDHDLRGAR